MEEQVEAVGMNVKKVRVVDIESDEMNARQHSSDNIKAIKESLERFGQQKPIVVSKRHGTVIAGNGTLEAAKALGWDTIVVVYSELEYEESVAYAIADNRTSELSDWDETRLSSTMEFLNQESPKGVTGLGWEAHEVDRILGREWPESEGSEAKQEPAVVSVDASDEEDDPLHLSMPEAIDEELERASGREPEPTDEMMIPLLFNEYQLDRIEEMSHRISPDDYLSKQETIMKMIEFVDAQYSRMS